MNSVVGLLRFVALNGATALAALACASRCRLGSRAERLLAAAVLYCGIALASGLALGLVGLLRFWPVLLLQVVLAAAAAARARWDVVRETVPPPPAAPLITGRLQWAAVAITAVAYLYVAFLGLVSQPFTGDELMYHLPLVAAYAQAGRIVVPHLGEYWNTDLWAYYPGNAYVLYQWWVLPTGNGAVVDLVQYPYVLGTALATFVLARALGARRGAALWSVLLFLTVPIVINQAKTAMVDVTVSFFFVAGLVFLLRAPLNGERLLLGALAWGIAPGVKLTVLVYLPLGAACVALQCIDTLGWRAALRPLRRVAGVLAAGVVVFSGYWFARNWWLTGSPVFPANLAPNTGMSWSNIIFWGPLIPLADFTMYGPQYFYNYETGAGIQFVSLALPAAAALALWSWRRRRFGLLATAGLALLAYPFWVYRESRSLQTLFRYVLPAMPIGFAAAGWLLSRTSRPRWVAGLAAGAVAFSTVNALPHVGSFVDPASVRAGVSRLVLDDPALGRFDRMGDLALQDYRRAWHFLDQLSGARRIAAYHLIFTYPMLGADWQRRLYFPEAVTRSGWMAALRRRHIDHVAVAQVMNGNAVVVVENGGLRFELSGANTGDKSVAVMRPLTPTPIRALRIRYTLSSPLDSRVVVGLNGFSTSIELSPVSGGGEHKYTLQWSGELRSLQLLLHFVPRTSLNDDLTLRVSSIDLIGNSGDAQPLPLQSHDWALLQWPVEYYWMESDPVHFHLVFRDTDYWSSPSSGEMRIYEVLQGDER